jgi:hypothetical protein
LHEDPARAGKPAVAKVGSQAVPIVEVDSLPLDTVKGRKRRKLSGNDADVSRPRAPIGPKNTSARSRSAGQQLALVPPEPPKEPAPMPKPAKRRQAARAGGLNEMS